MFSVPAQVRSPGQPPSQINHICEQHPIFINRVVIIFHKKVLHHVRAPKSAGLIKGYGERAVPCPHLENGVSILIRLRNKINEPLAVSPPLKGGGHGQIFNFKNSSALVRHHAFAHDLFLLTAKPVLYVCNVDEASAVSGNAYVEAVREAVKDEGAEILVVAAKIESEIAELETYDERQMFLQEIGLEESGVNRLIKAAYKLLDLQTFLTAGPDEVRAWTFHKGWKAPQCAGVIHTDFEKGFIRAEVIKYEDYIAYGSETAVKEAGKMNVEGKEYVVQDGDIMHFRFNV